MAVYLSRADLAAYIGQTVTIRRHLTPGMDRMSLLIGTLTAVGERGAAGILPGTLRDERGESAVDLGMVLAIAPSAPATVRDLERRVHAKEVSHG